MTRAGRPQPPSPHSPAATPSRPQARSARPTAAGPPTLAPTRWPAHSWPIRQRLKSEGSNYGLKRSLQGSPRRVLFHHREVPTRADRDWTALAHPFHETADVATAVVFVIQGGTEAGALRHHAPAVRHQAHAGRVCEREPTHPFNQRSQTASLQLAEAEASPKAAAAASRRKSMPGFSLHFPIALSLARCEEKCPYFATFPCPSSIALSPGTSAGETN